MVLLRWCVSGLQTCTLLPLLNGSVDASLLGQGLAEATAPPAAVIRGYKIVCQGIGSLKKRLPGRSIRPSPRPDLACGVSDDRQILRSYGSGGMTFKAVAEISLCFDPRFAGAGRSCSALLCCDNTGNTAGERGYDRE